MATAVGAALCFNPLTGVHGVESALALGVALPFLGAALSGRAVVRIRSGLDAPRAPMTLLLEGALRGALLWLAPVSVLALNQLRVRNCAPWMGLGYEVLGPGFGLQLATIAGLFLAALARRRPVAAALSVPVFALVYGVVEFWATPAIFVFSHLQGWFPGTLYDVGRGFPFELLTYRAVTLCWLLAVGLAFLAMYRPRRARLGWPSLRLVVPALTFMAVGLAAWWQGPALGHRSTVAAIDEALGAQHYGGRCTVHAPREMSRSEAWRLVRDCDFRVARAEKALGVRHQTRVHAFLYRTVEEKQRWMGAGRTFIAKPWRDEVHLQLYEWPHPVLSHEVVHVIAGSAATGPFRISGRLGGWLPDPGLIEGIAVAIDWPIDEGMNPHQWSRAMRVLKLLPPLRSLVGVSFLSLSPRQAYAAAGSFTRFYADRFGRDALRRAYRDADFEEHSGQTLASLQDRWHAHLDSLVLPDGALELAEVRFDRSSIFETTCPHRLAELKADLSADLIAGDDAHAATTCAEILSIDAGVAAARIAYVGVLAREGHWRAAREQVDALEETSVSLHARAREMLADAHWLKGEGSAAVAIYRELESVPSSESERRLLQVKRIAIEQAGRQESLVRALLLGPSGRGVSSTEVVHLAHLLDDLRTDGLASYLAARQLIGLARYDLALSALDRSLQRGLPSPSLGREARRLRGRAAFGVGDLDRAESAWSEMGSDPLTADEAKEWLARIEWERARRAAE